MPISQIGQTFPVISYTPIPNKNCGEDREAMWFAKTNWQAIAVELITVNNTLHRLEEFARATGLDDSNLRILTRLRCAHVGIWGGNFLKGTQPCPDICLEYEEQPGFVTRRVDCE